MLEPACAVTTIAPSFACSSGTSLSRQMATHANLTDLSEAEFGCEHLAVVLAQEANAAGQYRTRFLKAHELLAPKASRASGTRPAKKSSPTTSARRLLRPKYTCLDCFEVFEISERRSHTAESGHQFYMESRNRLLYCQGCADFVYDHGLDRLRSTMAGIADQVMQKRKYSGQNSDPENENEVWLRNNATKRPCGREGVRGCFNLGQTCYQNVIVQTMVHDPVVSAHFLNNDHAVFNCAKGIPGCAMCGLAEAVLEFHTHDRSDGFGVANLLHASWKANPMLAGSHQQDAHEYYQFLVNKLHELYVAYNGTDTDAPDGSGCQCFFHKVFYGKLRSSVTCDSCGHASRTDDPMLDLSLDIQMQTKKRAVGGLGVSAMPTLKACLESFTAPEKLLASVWNCPACGPQRATKQLSLKKLPAILCMQLKRFGRNAFVSEKVEGRIEFPLSVNMLPYTTNPNLDKVDQSMFVYDLFSVVVHKGSLVAGHYYAYCRHGNQWTLFNDDRVTAVSEAEVLNADAYLLFYNLRHLAVEPRA